MNLLLWLELVGVASGLFKVCISLVTLVARMWASGTKPTHNLFQQPYNAQEIFLSHFIQVTLIEWNINILTVILAEM